MALAPIGVTAARVALVADAAYPAVVRDLIQSASRWCLASVFIVDVNAHRDPELKVAQVLRDLAEAQWRGVETRLLIGGSRENLAIAEACSIARDHVVSLGLDCRMLADSDVRGSHCKFLVADDAVLTGSHNWSRSAFSGETQDSTLIQSAGAAAYFLDLFEQQWSRAAVRT